MMTQVDVGVAPAAAKLVGGSASTLASMATTLRSRVR
jgi:hypothetical protein